MKKFTAIILTLATIFAITSNAFAAEAPYTREATIRGSVAIKYNGKTQAMHDAQNQNVLPIFFDGTHYLPLRALSKLAGLNIDWDAATRTVILTSGGEVRTNDVECYYKDSTATVTVSPDITVTMDGVVQTFKTEGGDTVYPVLYNGTTYLPVRAVANLVGLNIEWDGENNAVLISTNATETTNTSAGTPGIAPIPEGNIIATPEMANSLAYTRTGYGTMRWLTEEECKAMGVVNGIVIDTSNAIKAYHGVGFSGVNFSTISYSIVAPSDTDVKTNVAGGADKWHTESVEGSVQYVTAGTSCSFTVSVEGKSVVGINARAISDYLYYIVNISFKK